MTAEHGQSDSETIERVVAGDKDAFRDILSKHQGRVYSMAYAITRNPEDSSEITQDVFIRFHRNIEQFDRRRPLAPYLLKIAVNRSRDALRVRAQNSKYFESAEQELIEQLSDRSPNPLESILGRERIESIRGHIGSLPLLLREITSLFYLSECSCSEVAEILCISENSVKVGLHRARKKIFEIIRNQKLAGA